MIFPTLFLVFFVSMCSAQSELCSVCQLVVSYTEKYVQSNESEAVILAQLDTLCGDLPVFGAQCVAIVNQYAPQLIAWLVAKENPQAFCASVGLCASSNKNTHHRVAVLRPKLAKRTEEQSGTCSICTMVMTYVEQWVAQNQTEAEIVAQLQSFCNALGPLSPECSSLVATYAPQMIQWIENKEAPATFCTQIGVCSSNKVDHKIRRNPAVNQLPRKTQRQHAHKREVVEETQGGVCQVCELVMTYVEQLVAQNNTIAAIEAELDQMCAVLPSPLNSACTSIVNQYLPQMVQWIVNKENPATFCSTVGLCTSVAKKAQN
jgi:saposin